MIGMQGAIQVRGHLSRLGATMTWTKPEFEIVEVTMEVTAYVARR
jgi:coenzyme PQQ precursor peptide PqqA